MKPKPPPIEEVYDRPDRYGRDITIGSRVAYVDKGLVGLGIVTDIKPTYYKVGIGKNNVEWCRKYVITSDNVRINLDDGAMHPYITTKQQYQLIVIPPHI